MLMIILRDDRLPPRSRHPGYAILPVICKEHGPDDRRDGCGRDELYDIVWSEPMMHAAKRFGVSGSYLARVCTMLNVPRPPQGYWANWRLARLNHPRLCKRPAR